jgi:hypothetical protein
MFAYGSWTNTFKNYKFSLLGLIALGYFIAFLLYVNIKPTWIANLDLNVPNLPASHVGGWSIKNASDDYFYSKLFDSVGTPAFTENLVQQIRMPEMYDALLGKRFAGQGQIEIIQRSKNKLVIIVKTNSADLSLLIARKIGETLKAEIRVNLDLYIARAEELKAKVISHIESIVDIRSTISQHALVISSEQQPPPDPRRISDSIHYEKIAIDKRDLDLNLLQLNFYLDDLRKPDLHVNSFMFPTQSWPRLKFFVLFGFLLGIFFVLIFCIWKGLTDQRGLKTERVR